VIWVGCLLESAFGCRVVAWFFAILGVGEVLGSNRMVDSNKKVMKCMY